MIDFIVISWNLQPQDLDTWVRRGAELSIDHHLMNKKKCHYSLALIIIKWQKRLRTALLHNASQSASEFSLSKIFQRFLLKQTSWWPNL